MSLQLPLLPAAALELVLPGAQRRLLVEGDRRKVRLRDLAADVAAAVQIVEVAVVRAPVDDRRDLRGRKPVRVIKGVILWTPRATCDTEQPETSQSSPPSAFSNMNWSLSVYFPSPVT